MFGFFKKTVNDASVAAAAREFGKTHKKKNTYLLRLDSTFLDLTLFGLCKDTLIPVVKKNGVPANTSGWSTALRFPNPAAQDMARSYKDFKPVMGDLAATVVEYLDKDSGQPVVQVYPNMVFVFDGYERDFKQHLNHASRRDFDYQLQRRQQLLAKMFGANSK